MKRARKAELKRRIWDGSCTAAVATVEPAKADVRRFTRGSVFYVIKVIPRDDRRYKFGYTSRIGERLNHHRCIAPDCLVIRKYKCHPDNEKLVIDLVRSLRGVVMVGPEVADIFDFDTVKSYLDRVFAAVDMTKPQVFDSHFQQALVNQANRLTSQNVDLQN